MGKEKQEREEQGTETHSGFPTLIEGQVGGAMVQTVNARDLHAFLEVGKDFSNWVKDRISAYGFNEHVDFEIFGDLSSPKSASSKSRVQATKEYALTLDMAKELAMVERNEQGRTVRRYFIACERKLKTVSLPADLTDFVRRTDGVSRSTIHKVTEIEKTLSTVMSALVAISVVLQPTTPVLIRHGKTAGQILRGAGYKGMRGIASWFGNRLEKFGCRVEHNACAEMGVTKARLFDPDKAELFLANGGKAALEQKLAERRGQGVIRLVKKGLA